MRILKYSIKRPPPNLRRTKGAKVTGTDRRGKYFWLKLDRKPWPVFHLGMTGYFEVISKAEGIKNFKIPPKLEIKLGNGTQVLFFDARRFGRVRLFENPLEEGAVSKLGFDPLFNPPSTQTLCKILSLRKAPIKAILLDQSLFAGVGNWVADEILFLSQISPHRLANQLSQSEIVRLKLNLLKVIKKAVSVSADKAKFPRTWLFHQRWGKKKAAKTSQGEEIIHDTIGGRTTAWVPSLQK